MVVKTMKEKKKGRGNEMFAAGGEDASWTAKQGAQALCYKPVGCSAGNSGDLGTLLEFISGHYRNNLVRPMQSIDKIIE